jgi:hypothetical protein
MWRYSAATLQPHVHTAYRHQFWMTNSAALVVADGTLWVYTRYSVFIDHSASNTGCRACTPGVVYCPIPTPYNLTKCPENTPSPLQYIRDFSQRKTKFQVKFQVPKSSEIWVEKCLK